MIDKLSAKEKIESLVTRFEDQYDSYKNSDYNETQTRRDFIDPFFKALGWDMDNEEGYAEAYREVINEDKVRISGATKAPDYSFRLVGGKRLFFVEAKKPSVSVKEDIQPAYQVRRYGWSAKLPISIITDFEEFAIYDCTKKPDPTDKSSVARIKYLTFRDYSKEFDFIWDTFSKEQVLKGSFDKFVQSDTYKKGTATVDKDFLESLNRWRTYLAANISWNNKNLDEYEINFVVQQTIDRLIFLRIAEDRSVEPYGSLKRTLKQGNLYSNLYELFRKADEKYNSGLFDFKKDKISENVIIENKIIKTIINELYYPECPFEFSVLPVEILGSAYEQFLGKVIRITTGHRAKIEDKPEVRKAGGVYYTPQYIVEYIVNNTVGKLIKGKTPKEISKIKIVDPACGSGSFLIGAFQYLLDYHKIYYSDNGKPSKGRKENPLTPDGHLTTAEKKRILINNIYGVDLDVNAVEVTKLSLLLKCMEGETVASIATQMKLFNERVLPTLEENIKNGNSIIDSDFYDGELDFGIEKTIKPFNWQRSFPDVFQKGGFDIVIGNPPYIQFAMFEWFDENQKKYLLKKYCSSMGRMNTFGFFIEKGIKLLNPKGMLGFIIPNTILTQEYYQELRLFILNQTQISNIVNYELLPFADAVVETTTIILNKEKSQSKTKITTCTKEIEYKDSFVKQAAFKNSYKNQFNVSHNDEDTTLKNTIDKSSNCFLRELTDINQAIALKSDRSAYLFETKLGDQYKPVLDGREINRYQLNWDGRYLKYDLNAIHSCKREDIFLSKEKIFFRRVSANLIAALDSNQFYALNTLVAINLKENQKVDIKYILGIFNSRLMNFYYTKFLKSTKKVFSEIQARQIGELPFIKIDFNNKIQKALHDEVVNNVKIILKLNNDIKDLKLQTQIDQVKERIYHSEDKINEIVNNLYGLIPEQIKKIDQTYL